MSEQIKSNEVTTKTEGQNQSDSPEEIKDQLYANIGKATEITFKNSRVKAILQRGALENFQLLIDDGYGRAKEEPLVFSFTSKDVLGVKRLPLTGQDD